MQDLRKNCWELVIVSMILKIWSTVCLLLISSLCFRHPSSTRLTRSSQSNIHEVVLLSPSAKPSSNNNKHVDTILLSTTSGQQQQQQQYSGNNNIGSNNHNHTSPTSQWKQQQHQQQQQQTSCNGLPTPTTPPSSDSTTSTTKLCQAPTTGSSINESNAAPTTNGCVDVTAGLTLPISPDSSRSCTPQSCASVASPPLPVTGGPETSHGINGINGINGVNGINGINVSGIIPSSSGAGAAESLPGPSSLCSSRNFSRLDSQCSQSSSQSSDSHALKTGGGDDGSSNSASVNHGECRWSNCTMTFDPGALTDHLKTQHIDTQTQHPYKCLWEGCKVYNRESLKKSWLEHHVTAHSGNKRFKCILDDCGMRFSSQYALERHVQSHFATYQPVLSKNGGATTPSKLIKKKKLKRKYAYKGKHPTIFHLILRCQVQFISSSLYQLLYKSEYSNANSSVSVSKTVLVHHQP
jgi:hypothetical protein